MLKLLVAVDGSDAARRAIDATVRLARAMGGAEVLLLNVRESPAYYGELPAFDAEAVERALAEGQQQLLDEAMTQAREAGLEKVTALTADGLPAQEIARVATEHAVDQIVMGTHGRNALKGLLMGSIAQRVVHLVSIPVLLVK